MQTTMADWGGATVTIRKIRWGRDAVLNAQTVLDYDTQTDPKRVRWTGSLTVSEWQQLLLQAATDLMPQALAHLVAELRLGAKDIVEVELWHCDPYRATGYRVTLLLPMAAGGMRRRWIGRTGQKRKVVDACKGLGWRYAVNYEARP